MSRKALIVVIIIVLALGFGGYKFYTTQINGISGLKIVSNPPTNIFLNDKSLGYTPYDDKQPPGEYILKLVPDETASSVASWQGKIILAPTILTYVRRDLGSSELTSSGEIVSMETINSSDAQIAVFSQPDAAVFVFDGQEKGSTPYLLRDVVPGEHDVAITSPGFNGRTVRVSVKSGYKVTVNFQLALSSSSEATSSAVPAGTVNETVSKEPAKPYVVIKDTPTGFLRVRNNPSTSALELVQIKPAEKYTFLEEKNGWYKITYDVGKEGWIAARYADKVD